MAPAKRKFAPPRPRSNGSKGQLAHYEVELKLADIALPTDKDLLAVRVPARPGTYVVPGDMIAVLTDASRLRVEIWATEDAAVLVQKGQIVKLRMPGYRWGELLTAKMIAQAPSSRPSTPNRNGSKPTAAIAN